MDRTVGCGPTDGSSILPRPGSKPIYYIKHINFMRKLALLLLLVLIPLALASDFKNLKAGDSIEDEGWNVSILRVYPDSSVQFQVFLDPNKSIVEQIELGENYTFDGININVTNVFYDPEPYLTLIDIHTEVLIKNTCEKNSDCNDSDSCTIDYCKGYPLTCEDNYINITDCISGDNCCQSGCNWAKDKDCPRYTCNQNKDCNDLNISTNDTCASNNTCEFTAIIKCITGDKICPDNCTYTSKSLDNRDLDCSQDNECIGHIDCDDGNESTNDLCIAEPDTSAKNCVYEKIIQIAEPVIDEDTSKPDIEYSDPPIATNKQIDKVLEKMPFLKNPAVLALISIIVISYVLLVFFKFRPEEPIMYGTH